MKSGIRILVVDDEDSVRGIVSTVLGEDGHQITEAENAEKALSLFKQSPFPVVITDIRMPGMDGIQLLKSIKALQPDAQVIIMTSHASLDNAIATLRAGAYDYLIKPFEDLDLINVAVNRAAERYQFAVENCLLMEQLRHKNQQLESANRILRELANRDGLTGLYNHRYFQEVLAQEISRSERHEHAFSLVFADVDGFKRYNDQYGHPEGDRLLNSIGQIINERLRKSDTAARYGGEEFIILLPETDQAGAMIIAETLRKTVETQAFANGQAHITISVGVATYPEHATVAAALIEAADNALYQAKNTGKNRVCVANQMG